MLHELQVVLQLDAAKPDRANRTLAPEPRESDMASDHKHNRHAMASLLKEHGNRRVGGGIGADDGHGKRGRDQAKVKTT